jgi:hypothetical protein
MALQGSVSVTNSPQALYAAMASDAAQRYGVDPEIYSALLHQESGLNPHAVSPVGARGIAQFMPSTAKALGINPDDPQQAIDGGARYLAQHLKTFGGDYEKALAAYNAGPGAVQRYNGVPPYAETQNYVKTILNGALQRKQQRLAALQQATQPPQETQENPKDYSFQQTQQLAPLKDTDAIPDNASPVQLMQRQVTFQNALNVPGNREAWEKANDEQKKQILDQFKNKYIGPNPAFQQLSPEQQKATIQKFYQKYLPEPKQNEFLNGVGEFFKGFGEDASAYNFDFKGNPKNIGYQLGQQAGELAANIVVPIVGASSGAAIGGTASLGNPVIAGLSGVGGAVASSAYYAYIHDYNKYLKEHPHADLAKAEAHARITAATMGVFHLIPGLGELPVNPGQFLKQAGADALIGGISGGAHGAVETKDPEKIVQAAGEGAASQALFGALFRQVLGRVFPRNSTKKPPTNPSNPKSNILQGRVEQTVTPDQVLLDKQASSPAIVKAAKQLLKKHIETVMRMAQFQSPENQASFIEQQMQDPTIQHAKKIVERASELESEADSPKKLSISNHSNDELEALINMGIKANQSGGAASAKFEAYLNENYNKSDASIIKKEIQRRLKSEKTSPVQESKAEPIYKLTTQSSESIEKVLQAGVSAASDIKKLAKFNKELDFYYSKEDAKLIRQEIANRLNQEKAQKAEVLKLEAKKQELLKNQTKKQTTSINDMSHQDLMRIIARGLDEYSKGPAHRLKFNAEILEEFGKDQGSQILRELERAHKQLTKTPEEHQATIEEIKNSPENISDIEKTENQITTEVEPELKAEAEYTDGPERVLHKDHLNQGTKQQSKGGYKTLSELLSIPAIKKAFLELPVKAQEIMKQLDLLGYANQRANILSYKAKTGQHSSASEGYLDVPEEDKHVSHLGFEWNPETQEFSIGVINNNMQLRKYFIQKGEGTPGISEVVPHTGAQLEGKISGAYKEPGAYIDPAPYVEYAIGMMPRNMVSRLGKSPEADQVLKVILKAKGINEPEIFNFIKHTVTNQKELETYLNKHLPETLQKLLTDSKKLSSLSIKDFKLRSDKLAKEIEKLPQHLIKLLDREVPC